MGLKAWLGLAAGIVWLAATSAGAADLKAYGGLPSIQAADISPSGRFIALLLTDGQARAVGIYDVAAKKVTRSIPAGEKALGDLRWADDDNLIVLSTPTTAFGGMIGSAGAVADLFDLKTNKVYPLLRSPSFSSLIYGTPKIRPGADGRVRVYVSGPVQSTAMAENGVIEVNPADRSLRVLRSSSVASEFLIDANREVAAEYGRNRYGVVRMRVMLGGRMVDVKIPKDADFPYLEGFGQDGREVLISYRADHEHHWAYVQSDGGLRPSSELDNPDFPLLDRTSGRLLGIGGWRGDKLVYRFLNTADQQTWIGISRAFQGQNPRVVSMSTDRKRWLVKLNPLDEAPAYYLVDLTTGQADHVGDLYRDLKTRDIAPLRPISFKAADGMALGGYLVLPRSAADNPSGLPLVVLPHDGPVGRDSPEFDWLAQALAAQGYAVLQVNFRGSDGLGQSVLEAGYGEWGRKMQTDLSDGVASLAAKGIIDPKRVCIVGFGYGGYAAVAGVTLQHDIYRCAASVGGYLDLKDIMTGSRLSGDANNWSLWSRFIGTQTFGGPEVAAVSVIGHADAAQAPILLIHSKLDTRADYEFSESEATALKRAGKPFKFVTLEGADHWLSDGADRTSVLQSVSAFLREHNPP